MFLLDQHLYAGSKILTEGGMGLLHTQDYIYKSRMS